MIWDSSLVKCEISLQYKYTKKKMIKKTRVTDILVKSRLQTKFSIKQNRSAELGVTAKVTRS